jgi:REP element-mobilizing transposase RayT
MTRPLRIEFGGAIYHVTSRGDRREAIFVTDADRHQWLDLLGEVCERFNWRCHSYCLMDNHYHLLVETVEGNLSAGMRQLNGVYTQRHNRAHGRVGHVFQGRFKAIIVQRDSYLLELARYVVLNPVRAGICASPGKWPWSSYRSTVGEAEAPVWLETRWLLAQFGLSPAKALAAYIDHVQAGVGLPSMWTAVQDQLCIGDAGFADQLRASLSHRHASDPEITHLQRRPKALPLAHYASLPERDQAMRQAYATGRYRQREIAQAFGVHHATVSRVVRTRTG